MEQDIRFCDVDGARIAVATVGEGPPLLVPSAWIGHVEADWRHDKLRRFMLELARDRTVIRFDRLGTGLSDRERGPGQMNLDLEARTIEAVLDELCVERTDVFGFSCGGPIAIAFAHASPERVGRMALYAGYADGMALGPLEVRVSMLAMVRAHWGLGSRMMAEMFMPNGDAADRRTFADYQRESATPDMAANLLQLVYDADVRPLLPQLDLPVQVLHRRGDRAVPYRLGRELAAAISGSRFVPLAGEDHMPWHGEVRALTTAVRAFLDDAPRPVPANGDGAPDGPLSDREVEILRMVARGLSDRQIAEALVLSPHTVHRHVANIRTKLRQPTRTAAATEAARLQLL